jgi:hypothetical protein
MRDNLSKYVRRDVFGSGSGLLAGPLGYGFEFTSPSPSVDWLMFALLCFGLWKNW